MLKNYFLFTITFYLFVYGDIYSQKTYVPDDNFEYLLICNGYDDVLDDYVLTANINTVERLNLPEAGAALCSDNGSVRDLTGIQDFISLKYLEIEENQNIHFMDLTKNIELRSLYIWSTTAMKVVDLDLTKNIALERIYISLSSISGRLDLSNCPNLAYITLQASDISGLNLM